MGRAAIRTKLFQRRGEGKEERGRGGDSKGGERDREVNKKDELKECGWRGEEEVINEAAIITGACLRQLCNTTHTYTNSRQITLTFPQH